MSELLVAEFPVEYKDGPDCPICHNTIVLECTVRLNKAAVRITGGDAFASNMSVMLDGKVVNVAAVHNCTPGVPKE